MMSAAPTVGIYGKLPAYGDFIFRNLKASFVNPWDEWLQHFISASKEQIGDGWLDIYLTSPIWRFVLSTGAIDGDSYAGIVLPSVDRVGRYFPLTVVKRLPSGFNPVDVFLFQSEWFRAIEESSLSALNGEMDADALVAALATTEFDQESNYRPSAALGQTGSMVFDLASCEPVHVRALLPCFVNALLAAGSSSFSLWMTEGSEHVSPAMFSCKGLPPIGGSASMLDGRWQQRNWKLPYTIETVS